MKYIFFACFMFVVQHLLHAQSDTNRLSMANWQQKAQAESSKMQTALVLTSLQHDTVETINSSYFYQVAFLQNVSMSPSVRGNTLNTLYNTWRSRLGKVLTAAQYIKYFNEIEENKTKWKHRQDSVKAMRH